MTASTPTWDILQSTCPSRTSLARIANKWTAMIVIVLSGQRKRFGDLRTAVGGISGKVLAETLRELERDGIVSRHAYDEMPPRVEYELTELGRTLHEPLQALGRWAEDNFSSVLAAREEYDEQRIPSGRPLRP
ncbi:winged helix-turn-helix transcriptional regulator [Nitriliruptor alkaliphilus]|uniref:winged helix-turn-helix transcriptional regulator n=1 Tax=Nitriliruptor alkaliphilus TaxID=427918 RepID=UPI000695D75F|nr:helix-turn-helix domain-containing protein [Nitriliruptor alkaliphilus]